MKKIEFKENKNLIYDYPKVIGFKLLKEKCLWLLFAIYYTILYRIIRPKEKKGYKYKVAICAIFKDEADYLKEWIEYHLIVGVEHFYLYNNLSSDNYLDVLRPYIEAGIITLKDWPKPQSQMEAYKDFFDNNAKDVLWVGFIDLDEYVVPNKMDTIYDFLKGYENRPSVVIYWRIFGSSGYVQRDIKGMITKDFILSWPKYSDIGKFFFNTRYEYSGNYKMNNYMHSTWGKVGGIHLPPVNVYDRIIAFGQNSVPNDDMPIQINHYVVKSYNEYISRKAKRGGGVHPLGIHDTDYFYFHENKCQKIDCHIYKFIIKLELALEENIKA